MLKSNFSLKALGAAAFLGISTLAVSMPAQAQSSFSTVLDAIRRDSTLMSAENERRLAEFEAARNEQAASMAAARQQLASAEATGRALAGEFDANEDSLTVLQDELTTQAGDFGELLGQFRTAAGQTMPVIAKSVANFEYPGRVEKLSEIAQARSLPTRSDLDSLPKAILQEMVAQSEVKTFTANVSNAGPDGVNADMELFRIGVFTMALTSDGRFVEVREPDEGDPFLQAFKAQPGAEFKSTMSSLMNASDGKTVRAPVDPSKGALFGIFGEIPGFMDRIRQGGIVGAVILVLLLIGALMALFKIFTLFGMGGAMRKTAKTKQAGDGNPLARVFETYEQHRGDDIETLELKLDEQILRETPKIERFNDIIKVLAAVAPLLGLLGTVIGMIITFTAITIYGAGDPQLMAGGISTALMTTVLGLVAAIPLLLLHAVSSSMARGNQQILDEQAAGLVAERAEAGRTAA
ncbi:MAG: MotA/TolQ/ExbB proton channel family protein [Hyphomonadaceae bacterium]